MNTKIAGWMTDEHGASGFRDPKCDQEGIVPTDGCQLIEAATSVVSPFYGSS